MGLDDVGVSDGGVGVDRLLVGGAWCWCGRLDAGSMSFGGDGLL